MNTLKIVLVVLTGLGLATSAQAGKAIDAKELGLSKTSVFETPTPEAFEHNPGQPGTTGTLPRYFPGAPPSIPHAISGFVPITASNNTCMGCHHKPMLIGHKVPGIPTPVPRSHYTDLRSPGEESDQKVDGARYVCTQCHAPQADAPPLVENTLGQ